MTRKEFLGLQRGQVLYHPVYRNADGTPVRWRVNGKMQGSIQKGTAKWPLKHGPWGYDYLHISFPEDLCLTEEGALRRR